MSNQWFRMYSEVLNDPKVQKLPADLFKVWVNTLCVVCNNNGILPSLDDVSFAFRMPISETKSAFHDLEKAGLIVTVGETFQIKNWKKRQYKSDVSTDRVKKHRNGKRNVSETPPEQNRTEQNRTDKNIEKNLREEFWKLWPKERRVDKPKFVAAWNVAIRKVSAQAIFDSLKPYLQSKETKEGFAPYPAKWLKGERWNEFQDIPEVSATSAGARAKIFAWKRDTGKTIGDAELAELSAYETVHGKIERGHTA